MSIDNHIKKLLEEIDSQKIIDIYEKYFFPLSYEDIRRGKELWGLLNYEEITFLIR